ncbi:MAG: hypothetical protein AB7O59_24295 [Pirellulales bacterium]
MKLFRWILGRWSQRQRALALYQQGMASARKQDHAAAILEYSAVIDMAGAPADVRAMALYNRSVVHSAAHNDAQATRDLQKLLETAGAAANVRLEAKRKLVRMERASHRPEQSESPRDG